MLKLLNRATQFTKTINLETGHSSRDMMVRPPRGSRYINRPMTLRRPRTDLAASELRVAFLRFFRESEACDESEAAAAGLHPGGGARRPRPDDAQGLLRK
ncbi:hypothetical protein EVAR_16724_1 [Eumeta japonica]|uniref:Uncharacterized protein n=1 Tax=Eumeta variegata TaxID=151549 RepID=A0A4C1V5P1_EUMVA|nr:hypothetical protein EVAR_16724_1 [Eumeta japonica]